MAHKKVAGWIIPDKLFVQVKIANELWGYSRRDGTGEQQTHLFFVGWYDVPGQKGKLFSMSILWLSIQIGLPI